MGIFDAVTTAVSGLQAQSFALQNISGNIANSQTTAFKGTNTQFEDLLSQQYAAAAQQTSGSVLSSSGSTITVQGDIQTSSIATNMAINGDGFFVVEKPTNFVDGVPSFNGVDLYTRRGDFTVQNGYLVNGSGYYLMGVPIDGTTGNPVGNVPSLLQFNNSFLPAKATTSITYGANLPTDPTTVNSNSTVANSDLISPSGFISNPLVMGGAPAQIIGTGASLEADAPASVTGTVDTSSYTSTAGNLIINGVTIAVPAGDTATQVASLITSSAAGVTATVNSTSGKITVANTGADTPLLIDPSSDTNIMTGLGLSSGTTQATNLLTQNAVISGDTLIVQFGPNAASATTLTFGTGTGQIATLAELNTALSTGLTGGSGTVDAHGDITLTGGANNTIAVSGSAAATTFGLETTSALVPNGSVIATDQQQFLNSSVGGGSITAYDSAGAPANIQIRWAKVDSASLGAGHSDTWNLFYETNSSATGSQAAWQNAGTNFTFAANGTLTPALSSVTLSNVNVNGDALGNIQLDLTPGALTQFADSNGTVNVNQLQQDGYAAGALQTLAVSDSGRVTGSYSNGQTKDLAQVTLATFDGESFLQNVTGGAYAQTSESGVPLYNATGNITPSSLEGSNTDIADEFTKLIITQQAYSANARVITTSNQMLQVVMNMVQ